MPNNQSLFSISELIKMVLDEIKDQQGGDTYIAVNCLLLSSTFYFNPASQGGTNMKMFLYELISDHKLWKDLDFWERAVTCKTIIISDLIFRANLEGFASSS